jgi:hypothetical protein
MAWGPVIPSERKGAARSMPAFDPGRFRSPSISSKSAEVVRIEYLIKTVSYKFCTKSAQSGGLEKNGRRERILGLRCFVAVLRFMCEVPCLLEILRAYKATENFGRGRVGGRRSQRRTGLRESISLLTGNLTGNFSNLGLFLRFSLLIN